MQQHNHRPFLPSLAATVKPSMNDIVFREFAGPGRGKAEAPARGVGIKIELRRLTLGGNEVRSVQKLDRLLHV